MFFMHLFFFSFFLLLSVVIVPSLVLQTWLPMPKPRSTEKTKK